VTGCKQIFQFIFPLNGLRRMLLCAALNIKNDDIKNPPPYIRVLAMNKTGMGLLKKMQKSSKLPVITKPASVLKLDELAVTMFYKEAACSDLYCLAYPGENERTGGSEWLKSPAVVKE